MSRFTVSCKKGQGLAIGQLLRQVAFNVNPSWRPVGYNISLGSNTLYSSPAILPDMVTFMKNLTDLQFTISESLSGDILVKTFPITNGKLMVSQLSDSDIQCVSDEKQLLGVLDNSDVTVTLIFRKGYGVYSREDNADFIAEHGYTGAGMKAMQSNHSLVSSFAFRVSETGFDTEDLIMDVVCKNKDEKTTLQSTVNVAIQTLSAIQL